MYNDDTATENSNDKGETATVTSDDNEDEIATGTNEVIRDEIVTEKCDEYMGTR